MWVCVLLGTPPAGRGGVCGAARVWDVQKSRVWLVSVTAGAPCHVTSSTVTLVPVPSVQGRRWELEQPESCVAADSSAAPYAAL